MIKDGLELLRKYGARDVFFFFFFFFIVAIVFLYSMNIKQENIPNGEQMERIKLLCEKVFDPLREWVGGPIKINSVFRSPQVKFVTPKTFNDSAQLTSKVTANAPITGATKTKVTYDSKGLVTGGADATTADIADSTNKRYVTDANLTVIGNTSGTNTGDETNITILSKLNFFEYRNSANGTVVTGTTAEVIVDSILIPAGTFSSGSGFLDAIFKADKSGVNAGWGMRLYIGPNNNNLTGATRIAINGLNTATSYAPMKRIFDTTSTQLKGFPFSAQAITDDNSSTTAKSTLTVDWTINQYLMPTLILTSGSDSCNLSSVHLKNF